MRATERCSTRCCRIPDPPPRGKMSVGLSRVEIESAGSDPRRLASALTRQMPDLRGSVPIEAIARELDILAIETAPLRGIEGCLQCDPLKSEGQIIVKAGTSPQRRRYTIAHELGHFLNERHQPTVDFGFACTGEDLASPRRSGRQLVQEREANTFAIEVLTPRRALSELLRRPAELDHALTIAQSFEISREAAIRRYVGLHEECLAAVFSKDGQVRYVEKSETFPSTTVWAGDPLGHILRRPSAAGMLTALDEADASDWIRRPAGLSLFAQTLFQEDGYAATLLVAERASDEVDRDLPRWPS